MDEAPLYKGRLAKKIRFSRNTNTFKKIGGFLRERLRPLLQNWRMGPLPVVIQILFGLGARVAL